MAEERQTPITQLTSDKNNITFTTRSSSLAQG